MTRPVASVQIDSAISDAAELMLERNFRHLAVVDRSNRLLGLITEHCLVRPLKLAVLDDALANETRLGLATLHSGETLEGAARFVAGAGRSGAAVPPTREPGQPGLGPVETGDGQR